MKSKTVSGDLTHLFDFGQRMPVGEVVVGVGITVRIKYGMAGAVLLSYSMLDYNNQSIRFNFSGGQVGIVYDVYCAVDTSAGNIYYDREFISVVGE